MKNFWAASKKAVESTDSCYFVEEGERLQRLACRKQGNKAAFHFDKAIRCFDKGLDSKLSAREYIDVQIQKGNCFLDYAQCVLTNVKFQKGLKTVREAKEQADIKANYLLKRAIETYRQCQIGIEDTDLDVRACLNCSLALTILAEKQCSEKAIPLFEKAIKLYNKALLDKKEDIEVLQDLAVVYIKLGIALCQSDRNIEGKGSFLKALESYTTACALCNANGGHNLSKLLYKWSIGYMAIAENIQIKEEKLRLLDSAIERLRTAVQFDTLDSDAFFALGKALSTKAKLYKAEASLLLYHEAIDKGYKPAQKIKKNKPPAIVGLAEANLCIGKIMVDINSLEEAKRYFEKSVKYYGMSLANLSEIGCFSEQCEVVYNYACVCSWCEREPSVQKLLILLLDVEWTNVDDIAQAEDFARYKTSTWFQNLLMKFSE